MLENEAKNSFGAYSKIGRTSAQKYNVITHKDEILENINNLNTNKTNQRERVINFLKRNGYHNIVGDTQKENFEKNLDDSQIDAIEDNIDIFALDNKNTFSELNKQKQKKHSLHHRLGNDAYKYHDRHMREGTKKIEEHNPSCTKYVPSHEFVWKRCLTGPKWETMTKRKGLGHQDNTHYYIDLSDPLKDIGHAFLDFSKMTMRGDFNTTHNIRCSNIKKFDKNANLSNYKFRPNSATITYNTNKLKKKKNLRKEGKKNINSNKNVVYIEDENIRINKDLNNKWKRPSTGRPYSVTTTFSSRPTTTKVTNNNSKNLNNILSTSDISSQNDYEEYSESSSELDDSYELYKNVYQRQIKKRPKTAMEAAISRKSSKKTGSNTTSSNNLKKYKKPMSAAGNKAMIKAPDFDKIISREYLNNIVDKKQSLIPFSLPNFKQVRERPIMMVVYDRIKHVKNRPKILQGIEPSMYNDTYKYLDKINNHKSVNSPNFVRMSGRPSDKTPLPFYMKKNYTREAVYSITDQSLKMNNYAEGKFRSNFTSFWPKKSFNKIVNLNLLNSDTFLSNILGDKNKIQKENNYIAKSMRFYKKNYEDLMKEGMLNRFDNVTYKTIKKENKIDPKELEKFLKNYQQTQ